MDELSISYTHLFHYLLALALSIARIMAALFILPMFSFKVLRGMPRYAICIAVALPVSVTLVGPMELQGNTGLLGLMIAKEILIGFILGFLLTLPFWMFQSIGVWIDNQRGALSGGYYAPGVGPDSSMLAEALNRVLVILFITTGAFPAMFGVLVESYLLWPPLQWMPPLADSGYEFIINKFGSMLYGVMMYAGPILLSLLLIEAGFAILGTYSPQLQVYFMAMPVKGLVALIVLIVYSDTLWHLGGIEFSKYYDLLSELPELFVPYSDP